jgi:predicted DNA-binding transcriptional regulator YafY
MYTAQPKKITIIAILDILHKYTDAEHRLSAKEIADLLRSEYDITLDRKAVKRNLMNLVDFGYEIEYSETPKKNRRGEDEAIYSDWYINHKFENSELRLLIDSLLFSKHIPYSQCKALIGKLTELASTYFRANVRHVHNLPENAPRNPELFYTIDVLDEAIQTKKQVSFHYTEYGVDKKKRLRTGKNGEPILYRINPYQMVATNGRYYLICNTDSYGDLGNYRVDRIADIELLKTKVKPLKQIEEAKNGLNLPKHMAEHIYMYAGRGVRVTFLADKAIMSDIVDWFGFDFTLTEKTAETVEVTVTVNETAMFYWAMQYGYRVEVLKPKSLRDRLAKTVAAVARKYRK